MTDRQPRHSTYSSIELTEAELGGVSTNKNKNNLLYLHSLLLKIRNYNNENISRNSVH